MSRIAVIADSHPDAGLGHLARSTALACALSIAETEVRCWAVGAFDVRTIDDMAWHPVEEPPDVEPEAIVVLDSYRVSTATRERLLNRSRAATFADSEAGASPTPALEIAPALPGRPGRLSGLEHACLRRAFWIQPPPRTRDIIERVLVSAGGGPATRAARLELTAAAAAALPSARLRVVGSPAEVPAGAEAIAPHHLAEEIRAADVVVTAAGQTAIEAAACGTPTIAVAIVDNQRAQARLLSDARAARVVDSIADVGDALRALASPRARAALGVDAQASVDGLGALRCARAVLGLLNRA